MEWSILHTLNDFLYRHDSVEDPLLLYINLSEALFVATAISELAARARPFVVDPNGVHLFSGHAADPGFPSDHATGAFAVAMAIYLRKRSWGVAALLAAAVLSVGRVAIGVHFPSDVLAGAVLGCLAASVLWIGPLRRRIDVLSDRLGRGVERGLRWGGARLGLSSRS